METSKAIGALSALGHSGRLAIFRLLVQAGPEGVTPGEISRALHTPLSSLSTNLSILAGAGLIDARRDGRSIIYTASYGGMNELLAFLMEDCCAGKPEICGPLAAAAANRAAETPVQKAETATRERPYRVLFLCVGNSCRSIMAEAIMNREGGGRFLAYSAGSMPTGSVNPHALVLLKKFHFDISGFRSKSWDEFSRETNPEAPELDFVFTICDDAAGAVCPVWPGQPMTAHWGLPDPALAIGNEAEIGLAFADTFRMLSNRIGVFMNLPLEKIDKLSLQQRLDGIGAAAGAPKPA